MELGIGNSSLIVLGFSIFVVLLDEYIAKPWRMKRWEARAASGDPEARELLRLAKSAHVKDE